MFSVGCCILSYNFVCHVTTIKMQLYFGISFPYLWVTIIYATNFVWWLAVIDVLCMHLALSFAFVALISFSLMILMQVVEMIAQCYYFSKHFCHLIETSTVCCYPVGSWESERFMRMWNSFVFHFKWEALFILWSN